MRNLDSASFYSRDVGSRGPHTDPSCSRWINLKRPWSLTLALFRSHSSIFLVDFRPPEAKAETRFVLFLDEQSTGANDDEGRGDDWDPRQWENESSCPFRKEHHKRIFQMGRDPRGCRGSFPRREFFLASTVWPGWSAQCAFSFVRKFVLFRDPDCAQKVHGLCSNFSPSIGGSRLDSSIRFWCELEGAIRECGSHTPELSLKCPSNFCYSTTDQCERLGEMHEESLSSTPPKTINTVKIEIEVVA